MTQPPGVGPALSAQPLDLEPIKAHLPPPGFWSTAGEKVVWQLIAEIERLRGSVGGLNAAPPNLENVTRFEVIDESGRVYTRWECSLALSFQDGGRTLKVFVDPRLPASPVCAAEKKA